MVLAGLTGLVGLRYHLHLSSPMDPSPLPYLACPLDQGLLTNLYDLCGLINLVDLRPLPRH